MGQIVKKRKKKGRPPKSDRNNSAGATGETQEQRRSFRRRNVKYIFDYEDEDYYLYEDGEEARKKEKELKQILKLNSEVGHAELGLDQTRHVEHAPDDSDGEDENKPLKKKRKIEGGDDVGDEENQENEIDDVEEDDDDDEVREQKAEPKGVDSVPGSPSDPPSGVNPLPDKKTLELILDKLQKKDIYGVYAEPVDPEELPDYHGVIEHPMDFATVRNKLGNGSYLTLEQFERDVFLICSNAMQYNASDTIYHKQAHSIQELAKRKFLKLRIDFEPSEQVLKSEQKTRSNSLGKEQIKKPTSQRVQEPIVSDFSSGTTLATAVDFPHSSNATQAGIRERSGNVDELVEGNSSLTDNNMEKAEDLLTGKGLCSRFGRKPSVHDENRRATYIVSNQPVVVRSESIFSTFEGESKQFVPVGLHADHSYARSLARFAATLGPVAWKAASRRIEQALPDGFKFGLGWVGEYEPLPTPILMLENCTFKGPAFLKSDCAANAKTPVSAKDSVNGPILEGKTSLFGPAGTKHTAASNISTPVTAIEQPVTGTTSEGKPSFSPGTKPVGYFTANHKQKNSKSRNFIESEKKGMKQVELNDPPPTNQSSSGYIVERQVSNGSTLPTSRSMEIVPRNGNFLKSVSFKQPNDNRIIAGGLPNGKVVSNGSGSRMVSSSCDSFSNQMARQAAYFLNGQEPGRGDPGHMMRTSAGKGQNQYKSSNHSSDALPVLSPVPSMGIDSPGNNATTAAAHAWMSIGTGGLKPAAENASTHENQITADSIYNPTRDLQPQILQVPGEFPVSGVHFQPQNNSSPRHAFVSQPVRTGNEAQFQSRPMFFPQLAMADLSRFQLQSPRQSLNPHTPPRQKQVSFPPDLNISFQSSGSSVGQSTGVLVDSQQPDLALQL